MDSTNDKGAVSSAASRSWANVVFAIGTILTILVLVPFSPTFPRAVLDSSYLLAMNQAVEQGLRFGRDIVFTFGPLASVYSHQYLPATDRAMLVGASVLACALLLLYLEARRSGGANWPVLLLPIVLSLCYENGYFEGDAVLFILPISFFLYVASTNVRGWRFVATVAACSVASGLLPLMKGSATVGVIISVAAVALIISRWSVVIVSASIGVSAATLCIAWLLMGQSASDLPEYFTSQLPLITGYAEGMSTASGVWDVPVFAVAALFILAATWRTIHRLRSVAVVALALMLFLTFKASFVRHDGHAIIAAQVLMLSALYLVALQPSWVTWCALVVSIGSAFVSTPHFDLNPIHVLRRFSTVVRDSSTSAVDRLTGHAQLDAKLAAEFTQIRKDHPLPGSDLSTDLYPNNIAVLLGNGLKWKPRPLLQSYIATTPELAALDAEYVDRQGAQRIYFAVDPIDGRYASLEDGPSWIPLMKHYRITSTVDGYISMDRMKMPRKVVVGHPVLSADFNMGQVVPISDYGVPVFARIVVSPTIFGRLLSLAYKPPILHMEVEYVDGTKRAFHFVGSMAKAGFVLSPTISSGTEFALLQSPSWRDYLASRRIVSFRLFGERGARFAWSQSFHVELQPVNIQSDAGVDAAVLPQPREVQSLKGYQETEDCSFGIDGHDPAAQWTRHGPLLHVDGWALISGKSGLSSDTTSIAIELPSGEALIYDAQKSAREDVASHFGNRGALMSGFSGLVNVGNVTDDFDLKVVLRRNGHEFVCTHAIRVSAH
ncbi:hypothetical protein [Paraburkholderia tropica]|uniref:hypothetical protein n=1 Tax=Paraburkholderia tropica TaxID=92647 RepID=UPI002AAF2BF4|nr:hypothetical protein [Paraburkholderia tropica]